MGQASSLSNLKNQGFLDPRKFNFAAQAPGGSLIVGSNTIALAPVPYGIAGANIGHRVRISNGVGTAESVLITGGTAVSGAASGTLIFTCANTHSGAWTITSATAGIQEAICFQAAPCLHLASGTYNIYARITPVANTTIEGSGGEGAIISFNVLDDHMFHVLTDWFTLRNLRLTQVGVAISGNAAIYSAGAGSTVIGAGCNNAVYSNLVIQFFYNAMYMDGGAGSIDLTNIKAYNSTHDGIITRLSQGYWKSVVCVNNQANGITTSLPTSGAGGAPAFMSGIQTYGNQGWGVYATCQITIGGATNFLNNDKLGELYLNYAIGSSVDNGYLDSTYVQFAGSTPFYGTNTSAPGILVDTGSGPLTIENCHFFDNQGNGIELRGQQSKIINCAIVGSGQGAQAGNIYNIYSTSASSYSVISNNTITNGISKLDGNYNLITDNIIMGTTNPVALLSVGVGVGFDNNKIHHGTGGVAYQINAGVTLLAGDNNVLAGNTVINNGALYANTYAN